ncbi:protein tramtrack, beta isoform-like isoform X5 [Coccinella septempunctata]|uniref:protein tramtrack, beta isoform-like isoform X5 n=1 Tax=Coccinella septempunctata TaxID=41139 RepID=UPI001D073B87|nr:protein tramtrack, beta isoform-like isoform X5 [Coccinella septempunctata]
MELPVDEEKYNLKWNSHHSIIANNILEHLASEDLVDVTLSCEGKFIRAHKLILSASSQYFKELFQLHQGHNPVIIMMNVRFEYIQYIIDYVYKGEVKLLSSEIEGILKLANDLQIKGLYGVLNKKFESLSDKKTNLSTQNNGKTKDKVQTQSSTSNASEKESTVSKNSFPNSTLIFGEEPNSKVDYERRQAKQIGKRRNREKCIIPKRRKVAKSPDCKKVETTQNDEPNIISKCSTNPIDPLGHSLQSVANPTDISDGRPPSVTNSTDTSRGSSPLLEVVVKEDLEKVPSADENHDTKSSDANVAKSIDGITKPVKQISAFMLFTEEFRPGISLQHPDENVKQISLRLSKMWKDLPNVKKDSYYEAASKENEILRQKMHNGIF